MISIEQAISVSSVFLAYFLAGAWFVSEPKSLAMQVAAVTGILFSPFAFHIPPVASCIVSLVVAFGGSAGVSFIFGSLPNHVQETEEEIAEWKATRKEGDEPQDE